MKVSVRLLWPMVWHVAVVLTGAATAVIGTVSAGTLYPWSLVVSIAGGMLIGTGCAGASEAISIWRRELERRGLL